LLSAEGANVNVNVREYARLETLAPGGAACFSFTAAVPPA